MAKKVFHHDVADVVRLTKSYVRNRDTERKAIDSPTKNAIAGSDIKLAEDMFLRLVLYGIKEFAPYLAESFEHGYGVNRDQFLADLTKLIGHKLGNEIEDIGGFSAIIQEVAHACVQQIRQNVERVGKAEISYEEAVRYGKILDTQVETISCQAGDKHSFYTSIPSVPLHKVADSMSLSILELEEQQVAQELAIKQEADASLQQQLEQEYAKQEVAEVARLQKLEEQRVAQELAAKQEVDVRLQQQLEEERTKQEAVEAMRLQKLEEQRVAQELAVKQEADASLQQQLEQEHAKQEAVEAMRLQKLEEQRVAQELAAKQEVYVRLQQQLKQEHAKQEAELPTQPKHETTPLLQRIVEDNSQEISFWAKLCCCFSCCKDSSTSMHLSGEEAYHSIDDV